MEETLHNPNSPGQQQKTGESTSSSSEDNIQNGANRIEEEGILRSMASLLTLLADDPRVLSESGVIFHEVDSVTETNSDKMWTQRKSRIRKRNSLPLRTNAIGGRKSSTPEREVPTSSPETTENVLIQSIAMEATTPDHTPPGLLELSPDTELELDTQQQIGDETDEFVTETEQYCHSRSWAQQKLAALIFSHPESLRNFCLEVYETARKSSFDNHNTEKRYRNQDRRITHGAELSRGTSFQKIPLSVTLHTLHVVQEITLDVSFASVRITVVGFDASVYVVASVWNGVTHSNPLSFFHGMITRPFNMMGKTTEVVVSGIQSVATGVGSASSIALHRLSAKNRSPSSVGFVGSQGNPRRARSPAKKAQNQKLLRKLNNLNSAAPVVSYTELGDNDGGLSRHAKSRVQRMMHYDISLRPFLATVKLQDSFKKDSWSNNSFENGIDMDSTSSSPVEGPFMCTPQSFPPTPASRAHVLKRGSRFADDVIFLARDQLRVHDGLESSNERTREMAEALTHGKRLAVFDADDASAGIDLSCGQHGKFSCRHN